MREPQEKLLKLALELKKVAIKQPDSDLALLCAHYYGGIHRFNFLGVYRDDDLELDLVERFNRLYRPDLNCVKSDKVLHVISEPYQSGGHTRLLERLVSMDEWHAEVLVTRPYARDSKSLRLKDSVKVISHEKGYDVLELAKILSQYKTVILHIHPEDIVTAVALGIVRRHFDIRVVFINHADHVFSYGYCSSDIVAEVSSFGFALSRARRGVASSYLGIPLPVPHFPECRNLKSQKLNIFSSGSSGKFNPIKNYSYIKLTKKILRKVSGSKVTIIGPSYRKNFWWVLKIMYPLRLKLYKVLSYEKYIQFIQSADVYIDSLPMSGGTAISEVRAKGIPVTGVSTGALGYSVFDQIKFSSESDVIDALNDFKSGNADNVLIKRNNSKSVLNDVKAIHSMERVRDRYYEIVLNGSIFEPMIIDIEEDVSFYERYFCGRNRVNVVPSELSNLSRSHALPLSMVVSFFFMAGFKQKMTFIKLRLKSVFR